MLLWPATRLRRASSGADRGASIRLGSGSSGSTTSTASSPPVAWCRVIGSAQVSGVTYTWSASAAAGSKVSEVRIGGVPLDPSASYRVAVNNFLASGGDNFSVLTQGTNQV